MVSIRHELDPASRRVIEQHHERPGRLLQALTEAHVQVLVEVESYVKTNKLTGQDVNVRSGALRQAITHEIDGFLSGWVGTSEGPASAYAATILGDQLVKITPQNAKHLWIPVADNLTASGQMRMSPREAFEQRGPRGGRLLSIFRSKSGNLVAVLRTGGVRKRSNYKTGRMAGEAKGKLLYVLKDHVEIQGTDALAEGANEMRPRMVEIYRQKIASVEGLN